MKSFIRPVKLKKKSGSHAPKERKEFINPKTTDPNTEIVTPLEQDSEEKSGKEGSTVIFEFKASSPQAKLPSETAEPLFDPVTGLPILSADDELSEKIHSALGGSESPLWSASETRKRRRRHKR